MHILFKDLASRGTISFRERLDLSGDLPKKGSLLNYGPLEVALEAHDKSGAAEVTGTMSIEVEQACSRCLTPVREKLDIPFHETFVRVEPQDLPDEDDEEDDDVEYVTEERLELRPYLLESVMFAIPYVPLCEEACQGLCPVCGANRNTEACGCKQDKVDPRLAGLADFFKDQT
ncbi:DUF177 domain-containing protein [Paenibacillus filicis]|uniref:DUF177 domain-containing protein n=1 Tax=Paenibacillus gyeongsangnamensis TaxID=3388067 RepID=A0ABT4Q6P6_9BACL|nr:DUF177 domain-containing protein [Paenibacillus filicis]MCZ8512466.1 DUF177 domain-containing protein [Paenibacillus filicis]